MKPEKLTIKEWAESDRPREKMIDKGKNALSDAELLAILIGSGTRNQTALDVAQNILNSVNDNLNELGKLSIKDLCKFPGIGSARAVNISSALELGRRRKSTDPSDKCQIRNAEDIFNEFHPLLADLPHEELWILLLNRANKIINKILVSKGGTSATVADTKLMVKSAIDFLACSVALIHNHPSGSLVASKNDIDVSLKLKTALSFFDINLIDHVIIADNNYLSLSSQGYI